MSKLILSIKNLNKSFGDVVALENLNLEIFEGEFVTVLGPSGCGKTTLLRIIAGLENPDSGVVFLNGINVEKTPPEKRDVNTVFQNYALFPHMNVFDNIAYGLKLRKLSKEAIKDSVSDVLKLVRLSGHEKRKVSELSGGQKQRVAIARALVLKPKLLLLDEPLGALDYKLRVSMQSELKRIQKTLNTTFLYITHDQDEALNLSDRIVLMSNAKIEQIGTPDEIYKKPKSLFAARFVGEPNILKGIDDGNGNFDFGLFKKRCDDFNGSAYAIIRPENICISDSGISAVVEQQSLMGGVIITQLKLHNNSSVKMHSFSVDKFNKGDIVKICCKFDDAHIIYATDEEFSNEG